MDNDDIEDVALSPRQLLRPTPLSGGNSYLWRLKHEVEDDRYLRIIDDIAKLIRISEIACDEAMKSGSKEYAHIVTDTECDYIEELIGAAFLILQAKIRRVVNAAVQLAAAMKSNQHIEISSLVDNSTIKAIGGGYKGTDTSLISFVWELANYFKHRDDWTHDVWASEEELAEFPPQNKPRAYELKTRQIVQLAGIVEFSTGNMTTGLEFFDITSYSSCVKLAKSVQRWADEVYTVGKSELKAATDSR